MYFTFSAVYHFKNLGSLNLIAFLFYQSVCLVSVVQGF